MGPLRGRGRRQWAEQLPPGAPPDWVGPGRPQPLPAQNAVSQVFTTYDAKPVRSHMFAMTRNAPKQDDPSTGGGRWDFDIVCRRGFVMVLREVKVAAHVAQAVIGSRSSTFYRLAPPGRMEFLLLLNGAPLVDVENPGNQGDITFANMGERWPVYLVAREGDKVTLRARTYFNWDYGSDSDLDAVFYGDYLSARGLPGDLEVGHDAPQVRPVKGPT
jgi:hypothetical protein